jgi:hypothetical protein
MKKIQKVIESCNDCEFALVYERNGSQALICAGVEIDNETTTDPFLILCADKVKHYKNEIPSECPLENYEPKNNANENRNQN